MEKHGISTNVYSYSGVIEAFGHAGKWKEAVTLFNEMVNKKNIPANVVVYTTTIEACASAGELEKALDLLEEMSRNGVTPNSMTYLACLNACGKAAEVRDVPNKGPEPWQIALRLLDKMDKEGITADSYIYNKVIDVCAKSEQEGAAIAAFERMSQKGLSPG